MQYVRLSGTDALAFAQAQFANDVLPLTVGQWQWNAWLTAKGRVIAIFALLREDDAQLLMLLPDGNASAIAAQLQRFVFRRKLAVQLPTLTTVGRLAAPVRARGAQADLAATGIELDMGSAELPRSLQVVDAAALTTSIALPVLDADWRKADLRLGLARLDESQREQWTPQQLALDRLQAVSVKKGCYPGQEIVARTHFLGKAKRALQLLQVEGVPAPGDPVALDGAEIGSVVSSAGPLALAVLPLELAITPGLALSAAGQAAAPVTLLPGLER
ncbi:folate-binding protein YgfZ [Xanthomonas maliensis]|nr:folate-binding protein YgfZ [Xanthomonas maliensis]